MHVLYNFSLVGMVILDLQICLSRFCIAARLMALRREKPAAVEKPHIVETVDGAHGSQQALVVSRERQYDKQRANRFQEKSQHH